MKFPTFSKRIVTLCGSTSRLAVQPIAPFDVVEVSHNRIRYRRGSSTITVSLSDFYEAMLHYSGRRVTSVDLRRFRPNVFDSQARPAGHSCNVSVLFTILLLIGLAEELEGRGVRGDPYSVFVR